MNRRQRHFFLAAMLMLLAAGFAQGSAQPVIDLTEIFRAHGVAVDAFRVSQIGDIVILRGRTADRELAADATRVAKQLGYSRVANLIQIMEADDKQIQRLAERALSIHRSLDGCRFRIASANGVVRLGGTVQHEMQKDLAVQVVRNIDGVRSVSSDLNR